MITMDAIREFMDSHAASGLSLAAFARERGVIPHRAYAWRERWRRSERSRLSDDGAVVDVAEGAVAFRTLRCADVVATDRGDVDALGDGLWDDALGLVIEMMGGGGRMVVSSPSAARLAGVVLGEMRSEWDRVALGQEVDDVEFA